MGESSGYLPFPKGFATAAIHAGQDPEQWDCLSVVPPIVLSTTFKQHSIGKPKKYEYGRSGNPSRDVLEECIAALERGKHGLCFSSGLGATTAVLGLFEVGDHVICGDDVYGGTFRLFNTVANKNGIKTQFVDATNINNVEKAINPKTKMVWIETPTNPLLKVIDIKAAAEITKRHNLILVVDNTFLTPYLQRPLELGADICVHSLTKYMNGHSDIVMGAVIVKNKEIHEKLRFLQNAMGIIPSPFDCSQVNRGLKTLAVRMKQHNINGLAVAQFLEKHPKVLKVIHPGLPSHPQHELFKTQTSGHSGMVSIYIKGGLAESQKMITNLRIFTLAESLGGYESLVEVPSIMTHGSIPVEQRLALNITDNLIRLSVGLEDIEDLLADLEQALNSI